MLCVSSSSEEVDHLSQFCDSNMSASGVGFFGLGWALLGRGGSLGLGVCGICSASCLVGVWVLLGCSVSLRLLFGVGFGGWAWVFWCLGECVWLVICDVEGLGSSMVGRLFCVLFLALWRWFALGRGGRGGRKLRRKMWWRYSGRCDGVMRWPV